MSKYLLKLDTFDSVPDNQIRALRMSLGVNDIAINQSKLSMYSHDVNSNQSIPNNQTLKNRNLQTFALLEKSKEKLIPNARKDSASKAIAASKLKYLRQAQELEEENMKMEARLLLAKAEIEKQKQKRAALGGTSWKSASSDLPVKQYGKQVLTNFANAGKTRPLFKNIGQELALALETKSSSFSKKTEPTLVSKVNAAAEKEDDEMPCWRVPTPLADASAPQKPRTISKERMSEPHLSRNSLLDGPMYNERQAAQDFQQALLDWRQSRNTEASAIRSFTSVSPESAGKTVPESVHPANIQTTQSGWDPTRKSLLDGPQFSEDSSASSFQDALAQWRKSNFTDTSKIPEHMRPLSADTPPKSAACNTGNVAATLNIQFTNSGQKLSYMEKLLLQKFKQENL